MTDYHLPIRLESEANLRHHWTKRHKRARQQRKAAVVIPQGQHRPPCIVTITRVGKRWMDTDNLAVACKALRDGIADRLGVDDADPRVEWRYQQRIGEYAAIVRIES